MEEPEIIKLPKMSAVGGVKNCNQRESGIELLRIIAACSVIWLHTNLPWGIPLADGANNVLLHIFEGVAIPAVDIFILITGYFMVNRKSVSIGKPVSLLLQYFIFCVYFLFLIL